MNNKPKENKMEKECTCCGIWFWWEDAELCGNMSAHDPLHPNDILELRHCPECGSTMSIVVGIKEDGAEAAIARLTELGY